MKSGRWKIIFGLPNGINVQVNKFTCALLTFGFVNVFQQTHILNVVICLSHMTARANIGQNEEVAGVFTCLLSMLASKEVTHGEQKNQKKDLDKYKKSRVNTSSLRVACQRICENKKNAVWFDSKGIEQMITYHERWVNEDSTLNYKYEMAAWKVIFFFKLHKWRLVCLQGDQERKGD